MWSQQEVDSLVQHQHLNPFKLFLDLKGKGWRLESIEQNPFGFGKGWENIFEEYRL